MGSYLWKRIKSGLARRALDFISCLRDRTVTTEYRSTYYWYLFRLENRVRTFYYKANITILDFVWSGLCFFEHGK